MKTKNKIIYIIYTIAFIILLYIATTQTIQRFKCRKMTQTELFLNMFNSITLNFKECK